MTAEGETNRASNKEIQREMQGMEWVRKRERESRGRTARKKKREQRTNKKEVKN